MGLSLGSIWLPESYCHHGNDYSISITPGNRTSISDGLQVLPDVQTTLKEGILSHSRSISPKAKQVVGANYPIDAYFAFQGKNKPPSIRTPGKSKRGDLVQGSNHRASTSVTSPGSVSSDYPLSRGFRYA